MGTNRNKRKDKVKKEQAKGRESINSMKSKNIRFTQ